MTLNSFKIFKIHDRFLRSTDLERDWDDPAALENYIYTPHAEQALERIALGLRNLSSLRAWRITGDYGSGKSSFALLLANILNKRLKAIPGSVKTLIQESQLSLLGRAQPKLMPVLVTGSRQHLGLAILRALLRTLMEANVHGGFYNRLTDFLETAVTVDDTTVLDWVKRSQAYIVKNEHADGLALIIDEAGKFLEYATAQSETQDIFLLQLLGEAASRSGKNLLFIISIFHQGISAYSDNLSKTQQREWEKVAGRYEEIIWHYPVEQSFLLIASSLNTTPSAILKASLSQVIKEADKAADLGWFGANIDKKALLKTTPSLYPIHPTVIPVLVKLFAVFGQNQRSLYSFLLSSEPFGLQDFVAKTDGKNIYRLNDLYDYAKNSFGARLGSKSHHWKAIDSTINAASVAGQETKSIAVLKTIGIINLINTDELLASKEILEVTIGESITASLSKLQGNHYLHFRGRAGGFCLWPNTSVNLDDCYERARKVLTESSNDLKLLIRERLDTRPIVARRHYIETGNLRYFEIKYVDVDQLAKEFENPFSGDGLILVPLCVTQKEIQAANLFAESENAAKQGNILIVVSPPLQRLTSFLEEVRRWEWIERSIGELRQDRYAREEVTRQISLAKQELQQHLKNSIGLSTISSNAPLTWYRNGKVVKNLNSGKDVMSLLADICDQTFSLSPKIHNELINRRSLSTAAAAARLRLCERLFASSDEAYLAMDPASHPPEMSMYLSVLQEAGLHIRNHDSQYWSVALPNTEYDGQHCRILPTMQKLHEVLVGHSDQKLPVEKLFESIALAPFGVREGLIPLLVAVFAVMHEQELAFYEDGSFIPRIAGSHYLRLIKAPETFEIQYYPISSVRSSLFHRLLHELGLKARNSQQTEILDVIRPLIIFIDSLPEYVHKTTSLSKETQSVRTLLLASGDPIKLLFTDLPEVFGLKPISESKKTDDKEIHFFVEKLKSSIDELRGCYPNLLQDLERQFIREIGLGGSFEKNRQLLHERAESIAGFITELGLKSFCLRLSDTKLSPDLWLESLGTLVCAMPPKKWRDKDSHKYSQEIHNLTSQFLRVEATLYTKPGAKRNGQSVRVALTQANGEERDQVIHLSPEQTRTAQELEVQVQNILQQHGQVGMAAASSVLWKMMNSAEVTNENREDN